MADTDDLEAIIAAAVEAMHEGESERALEGFEKALALSPDSA